MGFIVVAFLVSNMSERPRDDSSRFQQEYTDDDFLEAVSKLDLPTATDVASELGCAKRTASGRLGKLEDRGEVTSTEVGQAKVWRLD